MCDQEKFELDRNDDPMSYSTSMPLDWRFGGANLANTSVGLVDSYVPNFWDHPINPQNLGLCDIDVHKNGSSSNPVGNRKDDLAFSRAGHDKTLEMAWNPANSVLKVDAFLPNGPAIFPQSLTHIPTDSGFIERAARFSCFNGGNFGDMMNSFGIPQSMGPYASRDTLAGHGLKPAHGGQSQESALNVGEQASKDVSPSAQNLATQGSPLKNDKRSESLVTSQDEAKQTLGRSVNESDRAESSGDDDAGGQDDMPMLEGTSGEPSNKGVNSKKRKRSGQV